MLKHKTCFTESTTHSLTTMIIGRLFKRGSKTPEKGSNTEAGVEEVGSGYFRKKGSVSFKQ